MHYLEQLFSLKEKVAVVVGGTGELCSHMAGGLAKAGATVVLVGRNAEKARLLAKRYFDISSVLINSPERATLEM